MSRCRSVARGEVAGSVLPAGIEIPDFSGDAGKNHRNRIDAKRRLVGRSDHLIGHSEKPLIAAAAQHQPEERNLSEDVVEAVDRNEGAAHAHLVARKIDTALDRTADGRALQDAFIDRELAALPDK